LTALSCLTACSGTETSDAGAPATAGSGAANNPGGAAATAGDGGTFAMMNGGQGGASPGAGSAGTATGGAGGSTAGGSAGASAETCAELLKKAGPDSKWLRYDAAGKLEYTPLDAQQNRILDYSYAGYRGGGVALPTVPVVAMLAPSGGDDSQALQAALDSVAALPLSGAFRGALLLAGGTFHTTQQLSISKSGVVLRGHGSGADGTRIELGGSPHTFLGVSGSGSFKTTGAAQKIADSYVPSGSVQVHLDDASSFKVGDTVLVEHPVTQAWVHFLGMDTLVRNGAPQTWLAVGSTLRVDRTIAAVDGNLVTFDVPLADSYDAKYLAPPGADVVHYTFAGRISEVGLEQLHVVAPDTSTPISEAQYRLLDLDAVTDAWVKDVAVESTVNTLSVGATAKRITIEDLIFSRVSVADGSAGYPLEITLEGTQTLVQRSKIAGDNLYTFATGGRTPGPNVFLNCTGTGAHNRTEPHMRWATGLLSDNVQEDDQINYVNRATAGSGHGWAIGWGVIWNSKAGSFKVEAPPGSQNACIGCTGKRAASDTPGLFDAANARVSVDSLYLAQLCERLGPAAVHAIGY
jgi:hypothetical protein